MIEVALFYTLLGALFGVFFLVKLTPSNKNAKELTEILDNHSEKSINESFINPEISRNRSNSRDDTAS
ncbi:hypothetical protein OAA09_00865 [bacterium]|nr:hypothetical protein [bacterium]